MDHRDLAVAVAGAKNLEIDNPGILHPASHSRGWDFGSQPSAFAVASLKVLLRSLPPFPIYILAGAVDGGKERGEDVSGGLWQCRSTSGRCRGLARCPLDQGTRSLAAWGRRETPRGVRHYLGGVLLRLFPGFYFSLIGLLFCCFWACQRLCRGFAMGL
jgi:hypothetical protein